MTYKNCLSCNSDTGHNMVRGICANNPPVYPARYNCPTCKGTLIEPGTGEPGLSGLPCPTCCDDRPEAEAARQAEASDQLLLRARSAEKKIADVRALHHRYRSALADRFDCCAHCNRIANDLVPYPCETIRTLNGEI